MHRIGKALLLLIILGFVPALGCIDPDPVYRSASSTTEAPAASKREKTSDELVREYGQAMATKTEAMDHFFDTFFSANFTEARNLTSLQYRKSRTNEGIEREWRRFYEAATKHGLDRESLSYRTDAYRKNSDISVVISPSGRVVMAVFLVRTNHPSSNTSGWQVNELRFFHDAVGVQSDKGFERMVLTDRPNHPTHEMLRKKVAEEFADLRDLEQDGDRVWELVVSDGWARVVVDVAASAGEPWQALFRQDATGRWGMVTAGSNITNLSYPESPYVLWATATQ